MWTCKECETENDPSESTCCGCGEPRPEEAPSAGNVDDKFNNIKVAVIVSMEDVPGKDRLKKLELDVGTGDGKHLVVVTNAPNVKEGARVVVACPGAVVGETIVKKATIGGVASEGMLCDAPMLGWVGGGAGNAALVPSSIPVGGRPPESRPRMDGK